MPARQPALAKLTRPRVFDTLARPRLFTLLAMRGADAEALNAFRRCRELLSIVLGMKPAAETERLQRDIVAGRLTPSYSAGAT